MSGFKFDGIHYTIQNTDISAEKGHLVIYVNNDQARIVNSDGQYRDLHIRTLYADNIPLLDNYTLNSTTLSLVSGLQTQIDNQNIETHKTVQTNPSYVLKPDGVGGLTWGTVSLSGAAVSHQFLNDLQGGQANQYFHLNYAQYQDYIGKTTVQQISGTLNSKIDSITLVAGPNVNIVESPVNTWTISSVGGGSISGDLSAYTLLSTTKEVSGYLNSKIDSINLVAGSNVTIVESPENTWTISSVGGGGVSGDLSAYTLLSTTKEVSGTLQATKANILHDITSHTTNEINALYFLRPNGLGGVMWAPVSISGSQVDHNTLSNLQGGQTNQYYHITQSQQQDFIGKSAVNIISGSLTPLSITQSISGNLQNQIRANDADITRISAVTGSYLTNAILDGYTLLTTTSSISANLQSQITNRATKVSTGSGTWNNVIVNSEGIVTSGGNFNYTLNSITQSISANLQSQINTKANTLHDIVSHTTTENNQAFVLKPDGLGGVTWGSVSLSGASVDHSTLANLQGGTINEYYHLTNDQYNNFIGKSEVSIISSGLTTLSLTSSISGNLQNQIRANDADITRLSAVTGNYLVAPNLTPYTLNSVTSSISASLQNQIRDNDADITRLASVTGSYATVSSLNNYTLLSTTSTISASLDDKINTKANTIHDILTHSTTEINPSLVLKPDGLGGITWDTVGISGASVDHNTLSGLQGGDTYQYYHLSLSQYQGLINSEVVGNISGSLQNQIRDNDADITRLASVTGSYLTSSNLATYTPLSVTSSISGSLQNQIRDNDADITRLASVTGSYLTSSALNPYTLLTTTQSISANLQAQIDLKTDGAIGGGWDNSSLLTLSTNQTTNLTVGSPIKFDTVTGDHTLSNYRVRITAGSTAMLRACIYWDSSSSSDFSFAWYNVSTGLMVGVAGDVLSINYTGNYGNNPIAVARVHVTNDTDFELRVVYNNPAITSIRASNSWASVESSIPKVDVGGGGWQFSSRMSGPQQTSGFNVGDPLKFTTIVGDHTLSNYRVKVLANSTGMLSGSPRIVFSSSSSYVYMQWYDVTHSQYVGGVSHIFPTTMGLFNQNSQETITARISTTENTEYELRIAGINGGINTIDDMYATVETTIAGFTTYTGSANQIIYKETLANSLTTKDIQLPLTCKAIRVTLMLLNPQITLSNVLLSVNGVSTGHAQWSYSSDGTSIVSAGEISAPYINNIPANSYCTQVITITSTGTDITFQETGGYRTDDNALVTENRFGYIDSTADITSITLTGSITDSLGAGSYIIVERLDADVAGGGSNVYVVNQIAHGLSSGNPVKVSAPGVYAKAQANTEINSRVVGVAKVINPDNFWIFGDGSKINLATTDWDSVANTSGGLSYANIYYLDVNTSGKITSTQPTGSDISTSVLEAVDSNNAIIKLGSSNNLNNYTLLSTTASISGSLQTQINAISGSYIQGTLVTTLGNPGSDTNVPSEKAVRSALNALSLSVSGNGSGSGGGGWGSSSQLTMTQQTTGFTAGSPVRFTSISGDHSLSNYQITLKAGTRSKLEAFLRVVYSGSGVYAVFQWYNVTAGAYIGNVTSDVPTSGNYNTSYSKPVAVITVATDTLVELRVTYNGGITSIDTESTATVESTIPQSNNTASDTYTASDATTITTSTSQSICDLTCGNVASGLYTVDGRFWEATAAYGRVRLQGSSDGGTNWTTMDDLPCHTITPVQKHIQGTYKHNQQLGNLKFRLYFYAEGQTVSFGNNDPSFGRKLTAVGPINSPSFGGGWGACSLASMSAVQTTGISDGLPVKFDVISGDHVINSNRIKLKAGSKNVLTACLEVDFNSSSGGLHYQWYSYGSNSYIGTLGESIPSTYSTYNWGSNTIATATISVASDTEVELRIRSVTNGSLTTPSQVAWIRNYSGASSTATSSWAKIESTVPTGGAWASSSVLTLAGTQTTGLTAGSPIQFANIVGDHSLSNYGVTVRGGTVAMLTASPRFLFNGSSLTTAYCDIRWYDVTNGVYVGNSMTMLTDTTTYQQSVNSVIRHRVSPTADTTYQLRIELVVGTILQCATNSWATVESTLPQPVAGGGWQRCGLLGLSANQTTGLTANSPVLFDTATGDFTVSAGSIIIKGGTKAELIFGGVVGATTNAAIEFQWYNVTTSAWEGTICQFIPVTGTSNSASSTQAVSVVTPASDTTYQVRIKSAGGLQTIFASGYTFAKISATALSGGAWAKSSVLKLSTQQTTNLTSGSVIRFDTIEGDHLLSNYRVRVSGGTTAKLTASLSLNTTTEWGVYRWYNYTSGAYVGTGSNVASVTANPNPSKAGQPLAIAIVKPSIDTEYELRFETNYLNQTTAINGDSWATVESTDPMWPSAGGWAKSSLMYNSTTQSNLTGGTIVNLDTVNGDHALSGNYITVKGGSTAILRAALSYTMSSGNSVPYFGWYDEAGVAVGREAGVPVSSYSTDNLGGPLHAVARVNPSVDTRYALKLRALGGGGSVTTLWSANVTVESTDPNPPKGGNWAQSSLVTLSANQTSNLAVGQPIRFDTISGDHTLSNYRVKITGGQKAELIANVLGNFSGSSGYINTQWYNVTAGASVGKQGTCVSVTQTGNYGPYTPAVTMETPLVDTEYELRVTSVGQISNVDAAFTTVQVHSTLPNASVTSQVIKKETVAANTTAWTVTLPVACKAVRVTLALNNATSSSNVITLGVNGNSTGHRQYTFSSNGSTIAAGEEATTALGSIRASGALDRDFTLKIADGETRFNVVGGDYSASDSLTSFTQYMRIAQSADISTLTFTGNQTNGIGAGSYIIVERVDADLSQDLGWQDYTPTCYIDLTSATTVPNITPSVRYRIQGKTLFMQGTLNFTGAPTGATDLAISLPTGVTIPSWSVSQKLVFVGNASFANNSTLYYNGRTRLPLSTDNLDRIAFRPQTTISLTGPVTTTSPFTWANGHQLEFDFFTEIQ